MPPRSSSMPPGKLESLHVCQRTSFRQCRTLFISRRVIAFLLLGAVALATLAAALLHGPALAGLGLVGAYLTPLIVSTEVPSYWGLYLYLAAVTAAAFALARARLWRWLAITAVLFSLVWVLPGIDDPSVLPRIFST